MASKYAEIFVLLGLKKEGFDKGVKSTKSSLGDLGKDMAKFAAVAGGVAVGVGLAGKALFNIGKRGAIVTQTADSFDFLSKKIGLAPDLLEQLQKASKGTISDFKLMSSTATLLAGTSNELGKALGDATPQLMDIAKAANKLNPALGTTSHMYESIALGIKRASPMILDNLGLTIKIGDANEAMAKQLGKSVEALTAEEKQMALLNATLAAGNNLIDQVGGTTESATDAFARAETNVQNLKDSLAKGLAPAIANVTGAFADFISTQVEGAEIMKYVNSLTEDGIISDEKALIAVQNWRNGVWDINEAMGFLNAELDKGIDVHEDHRLSMLHSTGVVIELTGHERALIGTLEDKVIATENATLATDNAKSAQDLLNIALKTYNDRLLFNLAAEHLSADAAFDLAEKMGLVDEKTVAAYKSVDLLTRIYDLNEDGVISLGEATDEYKEAVLRVMGVLDGPYTGSQESARMAAFNHRIELAKLQSKTITVTTIYRALYESGGGRGGQTRDDGPGPSGPGGGPVELPTPPTYVPPTISPTDPRFGYQHGGSMIVPPGYPNDTFPIFASSGELVNVFTKGQQGNFGAVSTAMSTSLSNVKPQWQEAIEKFAVKIPETVEWTAGEMVNIMGKMERDTLYFSDNVYRTMDYSSMSMVELMARMAETMDWFAKTAVGYLAQIAAAFRGIQYPSPYPYQPFPTQPSPWQPGTYDRDPWQPGTYDRDPWQPGTYDKDPFQPGTYDRDPFQPGTYDRDPWQPGMYDVDPWKPATYDINPWQPGTYDKDPWQTGTYDKDPWESGTYTVNNLNIYTNAPVDTDVPDLLLLRAWSSG